MLCRFQTIVASGFHGNLVTGAFQRSGIEHAKTGVVLDQKYTHIDWVIGL